LLFLFLGAIFFAYTYISIVQKRRWSYMRTDIKAFKKDIDIETFVNIFIDLIETRGKVETSIDKIP